MTPEGRLLRGIQLATAPLGSRLFRNNTAMGWAGRAYRHPGPGPKPIVLMPGDVLIRGGRALHAGLCVGSADLIGWTCIQSAAGPLAVFTAIEGKTLGGRATAEQEAFLSAVDDSGGIAILARTIGDATNAIEQRQRQSERSQPPEQPAGG